MRTGIPGIVLGATLLLGCGQETVEDRPPQGEELDTSRVGQADVGAMGTVFVQEPGADAQLVFAGQDSTALPADREDAVFLAFPALGVERDGVPNVFPPADSLARVLERAGVTGDRFVIVGEPISAGRAFAAFDYLGLGDHAALLDGGLAALASDPARTEPPASERTGPAERDDPGELEVDERDDMIVDAGWVRDRLDDPAVAILDARPPAEFSGETPGEGIERPGHIPGARNLYWEELVRSADDPRLLEEEELRRLFEEAGVEDGDTVVVYCRTGGQSAFLYSVARQLGYEVRLYDGSFIDWSQGGHPIEP